MVLVTEQETIQQEPASRGHKVLWLAPNLNHYKARMLEKLNADERVELVVLRGARDDSKGHTYDSKLGFCLKQIDVAKSGWGYSVRVWQHIVNVIRSERPDTVLMPAEAKHLALVLALSLLKNMLGFRLVSYNHSRVERSGNVSWWNAKLSRFMLNRYDHVIFYSELARRSAVNARLVPFAKTSYAPNTLDVEAIRGQNVARDSVSPATPAIVFIGRLLPQKGIERLLEYFDRLRDQNPDLRLEIIGDGPLRDMVSVRSDSDSQIVWHNALSDESRISEIMSRASVVFIPGETGLGIVHAFAYGKPFMTIDAQSIGHGPEVDYLEHGRNGLYLTGEIEQDEIAINQLLSESARYQTLAKGAYETGTSLNASVWVQRVCNAICIDESALVATA